MYYLYVLLIILFIFHVYVRYNRRGRLFSKIPGPQPIPFAGNYLLFRTNSTFLIWNIIRKIMKQYYPITRLWGVGDAAVCVYHPDDLEILLTSPTVIEKGYAYWYLHPWLKFGLLTSTDNKWRQRRKILTPAFHFGILKKYMEITSEEGERLIEKLKIEGHETVKNLIPFTSDYTLNVICESTMGVTLDKINKLTIGKYKQAIHNVGQVVILRIFKPFITDFILPLLPNISYKLKQSLKILHEFTDAVIQERRDYHTSTNKKFLNEYDDVGDDSEFNDFNIGRKKRLAMLDILLAAEQNGLIDNDGIKEEVDTFTFEGHDTSGMAMTFTLWLLAENKEAQNRARAEITEILDKSNGKAGITEVQEFHYLERCIKESLRLYPPVATMMRYTKIDLQLKHALVPRDSHIMIHLWDTHRDPHYWPDPDKFEPDRFLFENSKDRHPFAYVPFSAGPRNCIGQKFALMELKSVIGQILFNYQLEPVDRISDVRLTADIILRPLDPVHIKFIKINK